MKLINKAIVVLTLGLAVTASHAGPSSNVAWVKATRDLVASGNVENGKKLAAGPCAGCHGATGVAAGSYPSLAGQIAKYTFKQLKDYKDSKRGLGLGMGMIMVTMTRGLSDQDMADLAAFYSAQARPTHEGGALPKPKLVGDGNPKKLVAPCQACHGDDGKGRDMNVASLKGQNAIYLESTLKAYRSGKRNNDLYSRMRLIAKSLTDEEIAEIGKYYQMME